MGKQIQVPIFRQSFTWIQVQIALFMSETPSSFNLAYQNQATAGKIVVALERISEAFRVLLWEASKQHKLSPIQLQILIFLLFHEETMRKVSYLAQEFNMTKATVSDAVKVLAQKDLIRKETSPTDSRSYFIHLTAKGEQIAQDASRFSQKLLQAVQLLGQEEADSFYKSTLTIMESLQQNGVIQVQRMCKTCQHYANNQGLHFCKLINKPLAINELRVDCPEHEPA